MEHFVYILYSQKIDRFYVGESVNPTERVKQHNAGFYSTASTKITHDWVIFLAISCKSRTQAIKFERFIKRMRTRKFYNRLKDEPEVVISLLERFSD